MSLRRKLGALAILLFASALLSACDKCGQFEDIRMPSAPKFCSADAPR